jgi:hypothetical protein
MALELVVGGVYKNRIGNIIKVVHENTTSAYPYVGDDSGHYRYDGTFYGHGCHDNYGYRDNDLIEEVITGENMNDHERKIADLENRIAELESRLTPCDGAVAEPVKWSPVRGYWFITIAGIIRIREGATDKREREFGVERPTQQQAKRAAVEMRRFNRLLALRDELCGDEVVHWNTREAKYFLCHNEESKTWDINTSFCQSINTVYFTTLESAQRACEMLNSGEVEL